jgi:hypothetical protein
MLEPVSNFGAGVQMNEVGDHVIEHAPAGRRGGVRAVRPT